VNEVARDPRRRRRLVVSFALLALGTAPARAEDRPAPDRARMTHWVDQLAAPDLGGRGTPEDRERAAVYLGDQLSKTGVHPAPWRETFAAPISARRGAGVPTGRNLIGWIPGASATEHVLLAASYDGRAPIAGKPFPGADGRATGVAAVLEATRMLVKGPAPRRSVLVALFDLSDYGEAGARAHLAEPPVPTSSCVTAVIAERLGRSLGDALPGTLFVFGAERSAAAATALAAVHAPDGVTMRSLSFDLHAELTSGALPFEEARVPTLLVTAGAGKDDGTVQDVADRVDGAALVARTRVLADVVFALADAPERPTWRETLEPRLEDLRVLSALVAEIEKRAMDAGPAALDERRRILVTLLRGQLDEVLARGKVTTGERVSIRLQALQVFAALQGRDH
jgi:hypothetical protein